MLICLFLSINFYALQRVQGQLYRYTLHRCDLGTNSSLLKGTS
jgi:hypothetical protein